MTSTGPSAAAADGGNSRATPDRALVPGMVAALTDAGRVLLRRFPQRPGFADRAQVEAAIHANDAASLSTLRPGLSRLRPRAGWVEDELEPGALPAGEWWVVDPVEGNVNHVHGLRDWGVTATLVRDSRPVVTVVHLPLAGDTYTAVLGAGALLNGQVIRPSPKSHLSAAMAGTGQASPRESTGTFRLIGASLARMMDAALVVRSSVPATLQLTEVAAGRMDVFWQFSAVRSGLVSGALLVHEAGGKVTDVNGRPWRMDSATFLASAPGTHTGAVEILSRIS